MMGLVSSDASVLVFPTAVFSLCSRGLPSVCICVQILSYKDTSPHWIRAHPGTLVDLSYPSKALVANTVAF